MAALKRLGVRAAVGFSAVGSLREEVRPRDFLVAGGVVDWTKGVSFFFGLARRMLGGRFGVDENERSAGLGI